MSASGRCVAEARGRAVWGLLLRASAADRIARVLSAGEAVTSAAPNG